MPNLKGLQHVHSFACERLERLVFDLTLPREQILAFGYLYGQAMGLSPITGEGAALAVENLYVNPEVIPLTLQSASRRDSRRSIAVHSTWSRELKLPSLRVESSHLAPSSPGVCIQQPGPSRRHIDASC